MKKCSKCKQLLAVALFGSDNGTPDGLYRWCKPCVKARALQRKEAGRSQPSRKRRPIIDGKKECCHCGATKPLEDFPKDRSKPGGVGSHCAVCNKAISRSRYENNKESHNARAKAWATENPEKHRQIKREHARRKAAALTPEEREAKNAMARVKYAENREHRREIGRRSAKKRYAEDRAKILERNQRRKARLRGNGYEKILPRIVFDRDSGICHICQLAVDFDTEFSLDHLVPISHGGPHLYWNVGTSHLDCNLSRGAGRFDTPRTAAAHERLKSSAPDDLPKWKPRVKKVCGVVEPSGPCEAFATNHGLCPRHSYRFKRYGDPLGRSAPKPWVECADPTCSNGTHSKGLCERYYNAKRYQARKAAAAAA